MNIKNPIFTNHLFPELDAALIGLLKSLKAEDWDKQTPAPLWKVKDVAAHLLDGNLRALSMLRDRYFGEKTENIHSYQDLLKFLNGLNADWVNALKRLSPQVLIGLLESSGQEFSDLMMNLDPFEKAIFSVAWAGEAESANWFHVAREYTEKWHHQQQIRGAVGQEAFLYQERFYLPYLETSMRALPHHYRNIEAEYNTTIKITVELETEQNWYLQKRETWELSAAMSEEIQTEIKLPKEVAWRIFTKGISQELAQNQVLITGNQRLGAPIFSMLAVMA